MSCSSFVQRRSMSSTPSQRVAGPQSLRIPHQGRVPSVRPLLRTAAFALRLRELPSALSYNFFQLRKVYKTDHCFFSLFCLKKDALFEDEARDGLSRATFLMVFYLALERFPGHHPYLVAGSQEAFWLSETPKICSILERSPETCCKHSHKGSECPRKLTRGG